MLFTVNSYADFVAVGNVLSGIRSVFYWDDVVNSGQWHGGVIAADGKIAVSYSVGSLVTAPTILSDFPNAVATTEQFTLG
jgi:hypothetical protein